MKNILFIILALITFNVNAQEKKKELKKKDFRERTELLKDLSPEELANLKTKKMVLHLDLTEAQQQKMYDFHLKKIKERKVKIEERKKMKEPTKVEKPTKEVRLKRINERLDKQIEERNEVKLILTEAQLEKWKKMVSRKKKMHYKKHKSKKE